MLKIIQTTPTGIGETLTLGSADKTIGQDVLENGTVYCIKGGIHPAAIDTLRQQVFDYYRLIPEVKISYEGQTARQNYHSIEKGVSAYQKTLHYFHAYVFNAPEDIPAPIKPGVHGLFHTLTGFYNSLTAQQLPLSGTHASGKQFRPQIFQYPAGGGMFASHHHLLEPQKLGLILGFSKQGRDYREGGAGFEAPDGSIIDTSAAQDIGDIVIFRYDLKHWVAPCDIESPLDDARNNGRWSAVIPIY